MEEVMVLEVGSFFLFLLVFRFVTTCKPLTAGLDFLVSKAVRQAKTMLSPSSVTKSPAERQQNKYKIPKQQ